MPRSDASILKAVVKRNLKGWEDPLRPLIDEYLLKRDRVDRLDSYTITLQPEPRPMGRLSPSSICGCERQAAFKFLGVEGKKILDPDQELVFDDGHWRHHRWQATFHDMELVLPDKFKVFSIEEKVQVPSLYIAGSLDAYVAIKINGKWVYFVIDIKGANEWMWSVVHREGRAVPEHVEQLLCYMRAKKCRRGILMYDAKNSNRLHSYVVRYNKNDWKEVMEWCQSVIEQMESRKLPMKHPGCQNGNFLYGECPFKKVCFGKLSDEEIIDLIYSDDHSVSDLWERGLALAKQG